MLEDNHTLARVYTCTEFSKQRSQENDPVHRTHCSRRQRLR